MHQPNVHEVRDNLAEYLAAAERGEEVLICRRNRPVARLVAVVRAPSRKPRPLGKASDAGVPLPASFFEPLPDDLLGSLTGAALDAGDPLGAAGAPVTPPVTPPVARAGPAQSAKQLAKKPTTKAVLASMKPASKRATRR